MTPKQIGLNLGGLIVLIGLLAGWYWQSTGARAVPALIESLRQEEPDRRIMGAQALASIGPAAKPAVPALIEQALHDPVEYAGVEAAQALKTIDLPAARRVTAAYLPALADRDPQVRRKACAVLAGLGPVAKPAVPALIAVLQDQDDLVRDRAVRALGSIGIPAGLVLPALTQALQDKAWQIRYAAVTEFAFSTAAPDAALPALTHLLHDENKSTGALAQSAVDRAKRDRQSEVASFTSMLQLGQSRPYVLHQLAKLGPEAAESVPALIPILKDEVALHRYLAAEALGAIGPSAKDSMPALNELLEDDDPVVRDSAAEALKAIAGPVGHAGG
ncbi:MAG: HEAT repeat domain-containing protein [Nitrospirota bacterium]